MIESKKVMFDNGLIFVHHFDESTPFVVTNVLYKVGAKHENPNRTGFAHLFEHLMFEGSIHSSSYDEPLQKAGGENNAFTTNDYTNYYSMVPVQNIDVSLFLESDRMTGLNINEKSLKTQKKVVVEEFKEHYINQPYGNTWHLLRKMVYETHPYRWPTIGKDTKHISEASIEEVKTFYQLYYHPANAILVIAGNISYDTALMKARQYFEEIPSGKPVSNALFSEPIQTMAKSLTVKEKVPLDAIFIAFKMADRWQREHYAADILSDMLSGSQSSRLYNKLVKEQKIFSEIDAYTSASNEIGMFVIEGKINGGISPEKAEAAIWDELNRTKNETIEEKELRKIKNKVISYLNFSDNSILGRAINLAYYELLGDATLINKEEDIYDSITIEEIRSFCEKTFQHAKSNTLFYLKK